MKKIIYGCLIALLAINFGCEKDEINTAKQDINITSNLSAKKVKGEETNEGKMQQQQMHLILNQIPLGTETMDIYLNMNIIEYEYNNDPTNIGYIGDFNVFYRNYYGSHFTIYSIEFSNNNCKDNIEKWTINKSEYIDFVLANAPTAGSGTSSNNAPKPPPLKNSNEDEDEDGSVRMTNLLYIDCFEK
jgi:hypothetical protein